MNYASILVIAGTAGIVVSGSVVAGMVLKTISDGDDHAKAMMDASPPPPSRRQLETEEIYGKGGVHFELNNHERGVFAALARRKLTSAKSAK